VAFNFIDDKDAVHHTSTSWCATT